MISSCDFAQAFCNAGFIGGVGVPCSYFSGAYNAFSSLKNFSFYITANEGEALSIASGAWLSGRRMLTFCQNSGLGNMVDPLTSLNNSFQIPVLLLITWRGQPGTNDAPHHKFMGANMFKLLDVLNIHYESVAPTKAELCEQLSRLVDHMDNKRLPVALIIPEGQFIDDVGLPQQIMPEKITTKICDFRNGGDMLARIEAIKIILKVLPATAAIVATAGKTGRELFVAADLPQHFYLGGSMGCASSLGLGIAENVDGPVVILDGDGAALMRLENLTTIGARQPKNLIHVLLDNNAHDSTGGQVTNSLTTDLAAIAQACGYRKVVRCDDATSIHAAFDQILFEEGPHFIHLRIKRGSIPALGRPEITPDILASRFQEFLTHTPVRT